MHVANNSAFPIFVLERSCAESSYTKTRLVIEGESNTVFFAMVSIPCTNQPQQLVTAGTERVAYTYMCLGGEDGEWGGWGGLRMESQTDKQTDRQTDRPVTVKYRPPYRCNQLHFVHSHSKTGLCAGTGNRSKARS